MRIPIRMLLFIVLSIFFESNALAEIHTVESNGEYVMGDSDTKIEARKIALENAKRLALEEIGTYLESETVVKNGSLTKDEIKVYTAGIIQTTVLSENMSLLEDKTSVFRIRIKANVDKALLEKKIKEIRADTKRKEQIDSLQAENIKLLREVESLSVQLKSDKTSEYRGLRQRRESLLEKLEKNQNSIRVAFEKGTLLNLALKNKDKLNELKSYIDDAFQFMADNTVYTVGEPQIDYKGDRADLSIEVTWHIDKLDEVLRRFSLFYENPEVDRFSEIYIKFRSFGSDALIKYYQNKELRIKIQAGKWKAFTDIHMYFWGLNADHSTIRTSGSEIVTMKDIPTKKLAEITNIEAKVITK